jgi:sugar O-acyltransferase (sialic acid O-acetyltransferase NeuD family)
VVEPKVILGTGGMGREAHAWLEDAGFGPEVLGFLDGDRTRHGLEVCGLPILGDPSWLNEHTDVHVLVAIGSPSARRGMLDAVERSGARLLTLVHPSAVVGPRTTLGVGSIVCPGAVLTCDVKLGRGVIVNFNAVVGHDAHIGEAVFLGPNAALAGNVTVGVEADIGMGSSVIQGVAIGARAIVGAGAVVVRDVAAGTTVVGVPATPVDQRNDA